jgi:hypothetical protein
LRGDVFIDPRRFADIKPLMISGSFISNSINRNSPWSGLRTPCSQLCTSLVETFNEAANTDCDIFSFFRSAMTVALLAGGGGNGSVVVFKFKLPREYAMLSSMPFFNLSKRLAVSGFIPHHCFVEMLRSLQFSQPWPGRPTFFSL